MGDKSQDAVLDIDVSSNTPLLDVSGEQSVTNVEDINMAIDSSATSILPSQMGISYKFSTSVSGIQDTDTGQSRSIFMTTTSQGVVPRIKLDSLGAESIDMIYRILFIAVVIGVLYSSFYAFMTNTVWAFTINVATFDPIFDEADGIQVSEKAYILPRTFEVTEMIGEIIIFSIAIALAIAYTIRIFRLESTSRVQQQINVIILAWSFALYSNPALVIFNELFNESSLLNTEDGIIHFESLLKPFLIFYTIAGLGFISFTYFYIWAQAESFLKDFRKYKVEGFKFYGRQLSSLIPYVLFRSFVSIMTFTAMESVPTMSFWKAIFSNIFFVGNFQSLMVMLVMIWDVILIGKCVYLMGKTANHLNSLNYIETRTQQVGFSFFLIHSNTYFTGLFLASIILTAAPSGIVRIFYVNSGFYDAAFFAGTLGLRLIGLVYIFQEVWVNLPPAAHGIRGWFYDVERKIDDQAQAMVDVYEKVLTYRVFEPRNKTEIRGKCFVLETAILLFNFSWIVYSYRGETNTKNRTPELYNENRYTFVRHIYDKESGIHCVIYQSDVRIIVAFKGTTSMQDWGTDFRFNFTGVKNAFPLSSSFLEREKEAKARWNSCKIHAGFCSAFVSVKNQIYECITDMVKEKKRPLFITGHSLGGALASLLSLGIFIETDLFNSSKHIYTYTFGSPKVGNAHFEKLYGDCMTCNWRVCVSGDLIPRLPKFGYRHVGNKALIVLDSGQLFIDPSFGELSLEPSLGNMDNHKKQAYAVALRDWSKQKINEELNVNIWHLREESEDSSSSDDDV